MMNNSSTLSLKSLIELVDYNFFIPDYQRGYRWTSVQVKQLLEDIWNFAKNPPPKENGKEASFYCLQPIVVKKNANANEWEVIDGQQRLTTIMLVIHYFNEMWIGKKKIKEPVINYETRQDSPGFISSIEIRYPDEAIQFENFGKALDKIEINCGEYDPESNIDFFHIMNAYKTIQYWVVTKGNELDNNKFQSVFLNETKVIWYEVEESGNNKSVDIFTRLNIGKIPLTNSELIKALFLMKGNFSSEKATLKQIQIASEWDTIEKTLQDDSFWYFIYNNTNQIKYENRIEYIFDLMKSKKVDYEYYYTFNYFYNDFESKTKNGKPDIDSIWLEVKKYFLTFEEWYRNYELYHYVGYLIDCGVQINTLKKEASDRNKTSFKQYLKDQIGKQIYYQQKPCKIDEIEFGDKTIVRRVLLLFNIITVLQTQKSDMRFPFDKYKTESWDIEHVSSQTEKKIIGEKKMREWVNDMLDYFIGSSKDETVSSYINEKTDDKNDEKVKVFCINLFNLKKESKIDESSFSNLFDEIQKFFQEDKEIENKDSICNLALLDSETNRSYGNSFFPIKRKRIINNDSKGIFVPIATKNLFLKYYSQNSDNLMYWTKEDAKDYINAMKRVLKEYIAKED